MRIDEKMFADLQGKTVKELKMQLSLVQKEAYRNSTKRQIITQIRLNTIVECEKVGKEGRNE